MTNASIIIIDICGTLYRSNTTFDFLEHFFAGNAARRFVIGLYKVKPAVAVNKILYSILKIDLLRTIAVHFLKGYSWQIVAEAAQKLVGEVLESKIQHPVIDVVNQINHAGNKLIIVSSTLDCIAGEVARRFGIETFYASELDYTNGVCAGRIKNDLLDRKLKSIEVKGLHPPFGMIISDNLSDAPLMAVSRFSYIVTRRGRLKKWKNIVSKNAISNYAFIVVE